jgi:hypothetical protein
MVDDGDAILSSDVREHGCHTGNGRRASVRALKLMISEGQ